MGTDGSVTGRVAARAARPERAAADGPDPPARRQDHPDVKRRAVARVDDGAATSSATTARKPGGDGITGNGRSMSPAPGTPRSPSRPGACTPSASASCASGPYGRYLRLTESGRPRFDAALTVLSLLLERVAEEACADTWRAIKDDLKRMILAQAPSQNGTTGLLTEPPSDALERLKSLWGRKPPPFLQLA